MLARLGPDPLRRRPDVEAFVGRVLRSRAPIATLLMDQSVVAGVGNVYRAEVLFRHRLDPYRAGRDHDAAVLHALWDDLVVLLRAGVRAGRIVTTHPEDRERPAGRPRRVDAHYVYGRAGLPCRDLRHAGPRRDDRRAPALLVPGLPGVRASARRRTP